MQKHHLHIARTLGFIASLFAASAVSAQGTPLPVELMPLGKDIGIRSGQTVTPAYDGWYRDDDGMIALSFGYYNRNTEQVVDIPVGPANRIIGAPDGEANQGQPTHFLPHRDWGVFTIKIPADYDGEVVWHLENQGKTFHIPANRNTDYVIDAIVGDANNNFPPQIKFSADADWGHGPAGTTTGPLSAKVGQALNVKAWVQDDGVGNPLMSLFLGAGGGRTPPVNVNWFQHQGPGQVTFSESEASISSDGGVAETNVTFSKAGEYMLRARVTEPVGIETSGHAQCCWTNGFVKVNVNE